MNDYNTGLPFRRRRTTCSLGEGDCKTAGWARDWTIDGAASFTMIEYGIWSWLRWSSSHTINHLAKNTAKTLSFFALDEPDVSVEVGRRGLYRGKEALKTLLNKQFGAAQLRGNLLFPFLTTGIVQVAGDSKTAKGTWRSPYLQAVMPKDGGGEPTPIWFLGHQGFKNSVRRGRFSLPHQKTPTLAFSNTIHNWSIIIIQVTISRK